MNAWQRFTASLGFKRGGVQVGQTGTESGAPVHVATYQDGRRLTTTWDALKAVNEGLKVNTWVYTACSKVARGLSSVPFVLEQLSGETWTAQPQHPIQQLLNRPNPFMARQDVQERWVYHLLLSGNALLYKNLVNGVPVELWPLMPHQIEPIPSRLDFLAGYFWRPSTSDRLVLQPEQVAHFQLADPSNPYWGLSPLQAAAQAVDTDTAAASWNRQTFMNDGRPPFAVLLEKTLTPNQQKDADRMIGDQIDGGRVRKALILGGASKVQPMSLNAAELDFLNSRRFGREEIGGVFGVPPILMVAGESVTYANLEAAKVLLWEDTILPLLADFTQGLQTALFPHWQLSEDQWRIGLDLRDVRALQANLKTTEEARKLKAEAFKAYVEAGVPVNQVNKILGAGFEDIAGGDLPRAPTGPPPPVKAWRPPERKDKGGEPEARLGRMHAWEAKLVQKVAALLTKQGDTLPGAYVAGTLDDALQLEADDWRALLSATHQAVVESEGRIGYAQLLSLITGSGGGSFDVLADGVTSYVRTRTAESVTSITDTTRQRIQAVVLAGVASGASPREIAADLTARLAEISPARALLIARTEVGTAFGFAHQASAEQVQADHAVELIKTWSAVGDARTRPEHAAMDGETVDLMDAFSNGLMQPGEPNCRCVALYGEKGA